MNTVYLIDPPINPAYPSYLKNIEASTSHQMFDGVYISPI